MLIWVCALHCEAKPVIDFYRLKKSHDNNAFDLYSADNMVCVISGIGKIASATASAWVAARYQQQASLSWINLGIAGAASHEIGSPVLVNQIIDADNGQRFYPAPVKRAAMTGYACMTLGQPSVEYQPGYLYDMEASGFIYAALRFSTCELTQCVKIVSDNQWHQADKNRQRISDLIHQNITAIDELAAYLLELDGELVARSIDNDLWQQLLASTHFSQTQKNRLQVLVGYLLNREHDGAALLQELASINSAKAIINTLETLSRVDSNGL
jgi:adenosylhomocysteine nucleosidase